MQTVHMTDKLAVASQPTLSDFAGMGALGFTTGLNDRFNQEQRLQPEAVGEAKAAADAGLSYVRLPVVAYTLKESHIRALQEVRAVRCRCWRIARQEGGR